MRRTSRGEAEARAKLTLAILAAAVLGSIACSSGGAQPGGTGGAAAAGASGGGAGGSTSAGGGSGVAGGSGGSALLGTGGSMTGEAGQGEGGSMATGGSGAAGGLAAGGSGAGGASASGGSSGTGAGGAGVGGGGTGTGGVAGSSGAGGAASGGTGAGGAAGGPPTVDLFNGTDLTGFNVYKATSTANNAPGMLLAAADAVTVFKPENGTIHVYGDLPDQSTQVHYLLQTVASYGKYNLSWDYKWGTKKFAPYTDLTQYPRDAGVLWHIHDDKTQVWPSSIEFQNKWGSTGDIYALYSQCKSLGVPNNLAQFAEAANGGIEMTVNGSTGLVQHMRAGNFEMPGVGPNAATGVGSDWNSCLLQVNGGTAVYTVNGHVVNRILEVMDKNGNPITSGPIAWQAEQAEVYYRNLRIQVLQ